jgi:hypothetical protein
MKSKSKIIMFVACITILISCAKDGDDGATGPVGPQGATGNTGTPGPGASVQTVVVSASDWVHIGTVGQSGDGYQAVKSFSIITSDIVSNGAILVFSVTDTTASAICYPVPHTEPYSTWTRHWTFIYSLGSVTYKCQDSDFTTINPGGPGYLRVVTIPGSARPAHPIVDITNYSEVKAAYNLQD